MMLKPVRGGNRRHGLTWGFIIGLAVAANLAQAQTADPRGPRIQYELGSQRDSYHLLWRERKQPLDDATTVLFIQGDDPPQAGPHLFNSIVRRSPNFLVSGDLPRFALGRTWVKAQYNPPLIKLGDLRIRCTRGKDQWWLDELNEIQTQFYPWGTIHDINLAPHAPLRLKIRANLLENNGIGVEVLIWGDEANPQEIGVDLFYGGIAVNPMIYQVQANYFLPNPQDVQDDQVEIVAGQGRIRDPQVKEAVLAAADPVGNCVITPRQDKETGNQLHWHYQLTAAKEPRRILFLATVADEPTKPLQFSDFEQRMATTQAYYRDLLAPYRVQTPDPQINAAFDAAIVNLDYLYQHPGWYEGIQKWNAFFVNNYQISAALALGQLDRVKETLLFNARVPDGPGQGLNSDGSVNLDMGPGRVDEGIVYYILQLYRYWVATGDRETLQQVWKPTCDNLEKLFKLRDPDGNLLLNWHLGCNFFLYQADHLSLPGDAFSPTIMTAYVQDKMAEMAEALGDKNQAEKWRRKSSYMQQALHARLWSAERGSYLGGIDTQGLVMQANYYTDFVYPQLYSTLPMEYQWLSLQAQDRALSVGDDLLRVGNLQPPLFGNNNVMPTQMSEAAEAYARAGRSERCAALLHGVARAVTIATDSPGSFPERMTDSGFGQPNYTFGNPAGSYVRGVTAGLFGLERTRADLPVVWQPALPWSWPESAIQLGDLQASVRNTTESSSYQLTLSHSQEVTLRVALSGRRPIEIRGNAGAVLHGKISAHPSGNMLEVTQPAAVTHTFEIEWDETPDTFSTAKKIKAGQQLRLTLPEANMELSDPQQAVETFTMRGNIFKGKLRPSTGRRSLFFSDESQTRMQVVDLDFGSGVQDEQRVQLTGARMPLDLGPYFNGNTIKGENFWRWNFVDIDLSKCVRKVGTKNLLTVGNSEFQVATTDKNAIILSLGDLHHYTHAMELTENPRAIEIPVNEYANGIELLLLAEFKTRLTNMQVGVLELCYADGLNENTPLIYGKNLDCMTKPFAKRQPLLDLGNMKTALLLPVQADGKRKLKTVHIRLDAADGSLGVLAVNWIKP